MAYDEHLAARVRQILKRRRGISEKKMFGGLAFLVRGNMCCGLNGDELMVRVGPDAHVTALKRRHAREMDFTGRALKGYVYVSRAGVRTTAALRSWVDQSVTFARALPPK